MSVLYTFIAVLTTRCCTVEVNTTTITSTCKADDQCYLKLSAQLVYISCTDCIHVSCDYLTVGADTRYRCHREFGDRRESVVAARTYFYEDEEQCEKNLQNILNAIDAVSTGEESSHGYLRCSVWDGGGDANV